jgi:hypothetical protein
VVEKASGKVEDFQLGPISIEAIMAEKRGTTTATTTGKIPAESSSIRFLFDEGLRTGACIKVVGVGGAIEVLVDHRMISAGLAASNSWCNTGAPGPDSIHGR